jgi:hypothetical protein
MSYGPFCHGELEGFFDSVQGEWRDFQLLRAASQLSLSEKIVYAIRVYLCKGRHA